jgi:hypothetical protein
MERPGATLCRVADETWYFLMRSILSIAGNIPTEKRLSGIRIFQTAFIDLASSPNLTL